MGPGGRGRSPGPGAEAVAGRFGLGGRAPAPGRSSSLPSLRCADPCVAGRLQAPARSSPAGRPRRGASTTLPAHPLPSAPLSDTPLPRSGWSFCDRTRSSGAPMEKHWTRALKAVLLAALWHSALSQTGGDGAGAAGGSTALLDSLADAASGLFDHVAAGTANHSAEASGFLDGLQAAANHVAGSLEQLSVASGASALQAKFQNATAALQQLSNTAHANDSQGFIGTVHNHTQASAANALNALNAVYNESDLAQLLADLLTLQARHTVSASSRDFFFNSDVPC